MKDNTPEDNHNSERILLLPTHTQAMAEAVMESSAEIPEDRRALARKRVKRIFKLPLTFKKRLSESTDTHHDITPTPPHSTAEEVKTFQKKRPRRHFLITDDSKDDITVRCERGSRRDEEMERGRERGRGGEEREGGRRRKILHFSYLFY